MSTVSHKGINFGILYSQQQIQKVVADVASKINHYYDQIVAQEGTLDLVVVCILKGAFMFYSDLVKHIRYPHLSEFLKCRSYEGTHSTGKLNLTEHPKADTYAGKHVLIVEDMHDTGTTLKGIVGLIEELKPKKVDVAVLVVRPDKPLKVDIKFKCLECKDFIVGYGLDFDEFGRSLPDIYQKIQ